MWRTQRRYNQAGEPYAWLVRSTAFINCVYFYCLDEDFGPFFIKFGTYFPYTARLCLNGNEWAKRQPAKAGIGFEALDNGFAAVDDVAGLQVIFEQVIRDNLDIGRPDHVGLTARTPKSSSTTNEGGRCAPRPPSTTRTTSGSPNG